MTTVLKNFVVVKKTRGDVLKPAMYRSTVEMINGITRQGDYAGFKDAYKEFLDHILDLNDPHQAADDGYLDEVITYVYNVYVDMVTTPLSEADFRLFIVPTLSFFELLKRIFLNNWLYLRIRNPDGSVPQQFTIKLTDDWGKNIIPNLPVQYTISKVVPNEREFIKLGLGSFITPSQVVFNASDLTPDFEKYDTVFHTSRSSPFEMVNTTAVGYFVNITGSSNDFWLKITTNKAPTQTTTLLSLLNINRTLTVVMNSNSTVSVLLDSNPIFSNVMCNDCKLLININKNGVFQLSTSSDGVYSTVTNTVSLSTVGILTTALIGIPLADHFTETFGAREISIYKSKTEVGEVPAILPLIIFTPQSTSVPLAGSASATGNSQVFTPVMGYKIYLTLSGTWAGTVNLQISRNGGDTWGEMTTDGVTLGEYTTNCDESVVEVTDPTVRFRLIYTITSGTLSYRIAQ